MKIKVDSLKRLKEYEEGERRKERRKSNREGEYGQSLSYIHL
jgi:hypothetical protein